MRPIDADALVEHLGEIADEARTLCATLDDERERLIMHSQAVAFLECKMRAKNFPTLEPQKPQWISVNERLPLEDEVLVLLEDGDIMKASFDDCIDDESKFGAYRGYYDPHSLGYVGAEWIPYEGVTHWMPLPEPPRGDADG